MSWQKYPLCFRLLSPLHIGYRKVGNLMQTRGYVPGKVLWAALTARLTRDSGNGARRQCYIRTGEAANKFFRFGYLYPALPKEVPREINSAHDLVIHYPWEESLFDYRFLDSYAGTALDYDLQAAAEGQLREVEFIRPWARVLTGDDGPPPVYLVGHVHVQDELDSTLVGDWRAALSRLKIGGERGYGWGRLRLECLSDQGLPEDPFPEVEKGEPVLAHVRVASTGINGPVEPLVGWERNNNENRASEWHLSSATICYAPGAIVTTDRTFTIGDYGIWK